MLQLGADNLSIRGTFADNGTTVSITQVSKPVGQYYSLFVLGLYTPELLADPSVPRYSGAVPGFPYYLDGNGNGVLESEADYV